MHTIKQPPRNTAFSLVELSIVLVILGLLVGGVLAGQSLIRAAELRAVSAEYQRFFTAGNTFRDKYFSIPGDLRDATRFWGRMNGNADCVTNSSALVGTSGACDGDGDGILDDPAGAAVAGENMQLWRQLSLAGLIEGTYTGLSGAAGYNDCPIGTSCPRSRLGNSGWSARHLGNFAGDSGRYRANYGNMLHFGGYIANAEMAGATLKPEEAWNIDVKLDDGMPGTGIIIPRYWSDCTTSTTFSDYAGTYKLNASSLLCPLFFSRSF